MKRQSEATALGFVTATLFGVNQPSSAWSAIATLPVAGWELAVGLWMAVKGFRPAPILGTSR